MTIFIPRGYLIVYDYHQHFCKVLQYEEIITFKLGAIQWTIFNLSKLFIRTKVALKLFSISTIHFRNSLLLISCLCKFITVWILLQMNFFLPQNIVMILNCPSRRDKDYFSYKDGKGGGFLSRLTAMSNCVQAREMKSCSD